MAKVAAMCAQKQHSIAAVALRHAALERALAKRLSRLARGDADDVQLGNIFLTLALVEKQDFDADALTALDGEWRALVPRRARTSGRRRERPSGRRWRAT